MLQRFLRHGRSAPEEVLYTFVDDEGRDVEQLTWHEARRSAAAIARHLVRSVGLAPGERVLLVYPPSLDFVKALLACLWAGVVPVPVCPPNPSNLAHDLLRFEAIARSSGARVALTNRRYDRARKLGAVRDTVQSALRLRRSQVVWPDLSWHATDAIAPEAHESIAPASPAPGDVALLQYTSGSTASPKGVRITHANLGHQIAMNARELGLDRASRSVMWLPHFHDFGLVSGVLSAAGGNGRLHMMSPVSFISRPAVWFEVMTRVRATHTAAPNFAYDLSVRKTTPEQRRRWDLRHLAVAMSAAEPVRAATVAAFCEAFADAGLRPAALCPAYGLAEHTVGVSVFGRRVLHVDRRELETRGLVAPLESAGPELTSTFVGCGVPPEGVRVRIVDPETCEPRGDLAVGEIWVDSASKADGYHGLPEETQRVFHARVAGAAEDATDYLRTGDLGFLAGGELYVTGRLKDIIILRGRNLYPQDIEASVRECHPLIRPGGVVAFSVDVADGDERLVVVAELQVDRLDGTQGAELVHAIRRRVLADHQVTSHAVVLGAPGTIPKTTSGKLRRSDCRAAYASGGLQRAPRTLLVAALGPDFVDPEASTTARPPRALEPTARPEPSRPAEPAPAGAPQAEPAAAPQDEPAAQVKPPTRLRVCVIGAGPSGLVMARELEQLGHEVTVLEQQEHVGGKCASLELDGRWYDLGGSLCTASYRSFADLVEWVGARTSAVPPMFAHDIEHNRSMPARDDAAFGGSVLRYLEARDRGFPEIARPGLRRVASSLAQPAAAWIEEQGLQALVASAGLTYAATGYGYLSDPELAAVYVAKGWEHLVGGIGSGLPFFWTLTDGFVNFWRQVADRLGDVRCGVRVHAVERAEAGVQVRTDSGTLTFDRLVVACPLPAALSFLDASPEELEVIGKIRTVDYYTTVASASGLPQNGLYAIQQHCEDPATAGRAAVLYHRYPDRDIYLFFSYGGPTVTGEDIERGVLEDVARMGGVVETVHTRVKWAHFPHFSRADIQAGIFERLEALQGKNNTYFLGSIFNFDLIECNINYARELARGAFAAERLAAQAQARAEQLGRRSGAGGGSSDADGARARDLAHYLRRLLAEALGVAAPRLRLDAEFAGMGLDSVRAIEVAQKLTRGLGIALPATIFSDYPTIEALADTLSRWGGEAPGYASAEAAQEPIDETVIDPPKPGTGSRWFYVPRPTERPSSRLFCFYGAGGNAAMFRGWPDGLPEGVEVRAIQLPGRATRASEPAHTRLGPLLEQLEAEMVDLLETPFALFGHSLGGLLAHELTRHLRLRGRPLPTHLFVSSVAAPDVMSPARVHPTASDDELIAALRRWGGTPDSVLSAPELLEATLRALRADLELSAGPPRMHEPPLDVPITAFGGDDDPTVTPEDLGAWRSATSGRFELHLLAGGHFYLVPGQAALLAQISRHLESVADP